MALEIGVDLASSNDITIYSTVSWQDWNGQQVCVSDFGLRPNETPELPFCKNGHDLYEDYDSSGYRTGFLLCENCLGVAAIDWEKPPYSRPA